MHKGSRQYWTRVGLPLDVLHVIMLFFCFYQRHIAIPNKTINENVKSWLYNKNFSYKDQMSSNVKIMIIVMAFWNPFTQWYVFFLYISQIHLRQEVQYSQQAPTHAMLNSIIYHIGFQYAKLSISNAMHANIIFIN